MKKFSFQLEPVLKYKSDILEVVKNDYSKAALAVAEQEQRIQRLEEEKRAYIEKFDNEKKSNLVVAKAGVYENYINYQTLIIRQEQFKLKQLEKIAEEKREKMIEAKKEKLSIEKLKDIKTGQYNKDVQ